MFVRENIAGTWSLWASLGDSWSVGDLEVGDGEAYLLGVKADGTMFLQKTTSGAWGEWEAVG